MLPGAPPAGLVAFGSSTGVPALVVEAEVLISGLLPQLRMAVEVLHPHAVLSVGAQDISRKIQDKKYCAVLVVLPGVADCGYRRRAQIMHCLLYTSPSPRD